MKNKKMAILFLLFVVGWKDADIHWLTQQHKNYVLNYTETDAANIIAYAKMLDGGIQEATAFFHHPFQKNFDVFVYPNRAVLDSQWQKDWAMADFKSECWMVASGVAAKLDMISPVKWDKEACEHSYADSIKTKRLITHELVHVYQGQLNASPDFSDVTGIDWFVEGLATYASGQYDAERVEQVKNAISKNEVPQALDHFWTGKLKYGLSGSVIMYIDKTFGREKLTQLLPFNRKEQILHTLGLTEDVLINRWQEYMKKVQ
jgi:hypothetical protein